jgi:hypothetical protein
MPAPASAVVDLSLPEIEALVLRAARGAGFAWGMAEECGKAAVWLGHHDLDWSAVILARLMGERGVPVVPAPARWASKGAVCGIHAGAALADFATLAEGPGGNGVSLGLVHDPLCLLPFVAFAAQRLKTDLDVMLDNRLWASFDATGHTLADGGLSQIALGTIDILSTAVPSSGPALPCLLSRAIPVEVYARLEKLALAMTVPATAHSQAGAGAAQSDND